MQTEEISGIKGAKAGQLSRGQQFLVQNGGLLDEEAKRLIKEGQMQFFDMDIYKRLLLSAGVNVVLDTDNLKVVGISNLDKNQLPDLISMILSEMKLAYGTAATQVAAETVSYTHAGAIPAALANGEIVVFVDDKPVVELPMAKFFANTTEAVGIVDMKGTVILNAMRLIKHTSTIRIEARLAKNVALPANFHYMEIRLIGDGFRKR